MRNRMDSIDPPSDLVAVDPNAGGQLDAPAVYGRRRSVERAVSQLASGRHLLLDEPRRFGKSSFAQLLTNELNGSDDGLGVYHSVQGDSTRLEFVESVLGAIRSVPGAGRGVLDAVSSVMSNVEEVTAGPVSLNLAYRRDPVVALRTVVAGIDKAAGKKDRRLVVCLDEVTETIAAIGRSDGQAPARQLLAELRRLRESHRNVSWIFTGSIGFHHVLRQIGTTESMINDMRRFDLGPLEPAWARWLSGSVLMGAGVERSVADDSALCAAIAEATDGIPILVHMIGERVRDRGVRMTVANVTQVLDECFGSSDQASNLTHLLTRLESYYGDDADTAKRVLDRLAAEPCAHATLVDEDGADDALLDSLEADHYLHRDGANRLAWKYPSLARLWSIRRGRR